MVGHALLGSVGVQFAAGEGGVIDRLHVGRNQGGLWCRLMDLIDVLLAHDD